MQAQLMIHQTTVRFLHRGRHSGASRIKSYFSRGVCSQWGEPFVESFSPLFSPFS